MKKLLFVSAFSLIALTLVSLLSQSTLAQTGKFRLSANGIKNRYIVVLNEKFIDRHASEPAVGSEAAYLTGQFGGEVKGLYAHALKGFVVEMPERAAIALSKNERVAMVEQDAEISASATATAATWALDRIDQRGLPLNNQYSWGPDGSGVHAYVIDSGIRPTHVDFGGRATADFDAVGDGQNGIDCYGHGTHVAGTIGSATYGVAKNVRIHGVRVLPCNGSGQISHLIMGIDWVTAHRIKPAVANISIIISMVSIVTETAIQNSINSGVTYVVAAGNWNLNACNYSPGHLPAAITVGGLSLDDSKGSYSNFGPCVDVWAPGSAILSLSYADDTGTRWMSGTSMASPHVAGIAALYLSTNPTASPATVASTIVNTSTVGAITGLDGTSPNRMAYSWLGSSPAPSAGRVTIKKRTARTTESTQSAAFDYNAANLASSNFTLQPDNQFVDSNVVAFGSGNMVTVTEAMTPGWNLTGISCVETSGGGLPSFANSTVDLANHKANIVVEEGEQIECTFTSEPITPTAAPVELGGRVVSPDGRGVKGITLSLLDASTGAVKYVTTNNYGFYKFAGLPVGDFYVLTAQSQKRVVIRDNVRTFSLMESLASVNFQTAR